MSILYWGPGHPNWPGTIGPSPFQPDGWFPWDRLPINTAKTHYKFMPSETGAAPAPERFSQEDVERIAKRVVELLRKSDPDRQLK